MQRRVRQWRATSGPAKEIYFTQQHFPGRLCASLSDGPIPGLGRRALIQIRQELGERDICLTAEVPRAQDVLSLSAA